MCWNWIFLLILVLVMETLFIHFNTASVLKYYQIQKFLMGEGNACPFRPCPNSANCKFDAFNFCFLFDSERSWKFTWSKTGTLEIDVHTPGITVSPVMLMILYQLALVLRKLELWRWQWFVRLSNLMTGKKQKLGLLVTSFCQSLSCRRKLH